MNHMPESLESLSPVRRAYLALEDMQARLDQVDRSQHEPLAVIGLGCRLAGGVADGRSLWGLLASGGDAIVEVPSERWRVDAYYDPDPAARGKMTSRWGGFMAGVDEFDAGFFGISPREARSMDPQQRLVLEVGWEALEDAGQTQEGLAGSRSGVFMGICSNDYAWLQLGDAAQIDAYASTGLSASLVANRLSYVLDLRGPSLAIDTACSSSLVAVHLACRSLRQGECELAVAGGVNLVLSPLGTISLSRWGMLAPDGRCKT